MNKITFIIAFAFILFSCKENDSKWSVFRFTEFSKEIGNVFPSIKPEIIYFIPMGGCRACVMESIKFSKKELDNSAILFVLTSQTGNKSITLHYSKDELSSSNIIVDGTGKAYQQNIIGSSITVYYMNKEKRDYSRVDVNPSAFEKELANVKERLRN